MQARHEAGKNAVKSGMYTGLSYFIVVALLVTPFFIVGSIQAALLAMAVAVVGILGAVSFYTAVIFERRFWKQFLEMFTFSMGVAVITFALGTAVRRIFGVEI